MDWLLVIVGLAIIIIILVYMFKQPSFNPAPSPKRVEIKKDMTLDEIKKYDHNNNETRLMALKGVIYDVTTSDYYKKGSAYSQFCGYDATVCLAKMAHDKEFLNKYGETTVEQWVRWYEDRYPKVGKIIKNQTSS